MSGLRYPCSQSRLRGDSDDYSSFEMPNRLLKIILDDRSLCDFFGGRGEAYNSGEFKELSDLPLSKLLPFQSTSLSR